MRIPSTPLSARTQALLQANAPAYKAVALLGASAVQLGAPDQFAIGYAPMTRPKGVLISLPGTSSYAAQSAAHWIPHCARHKLALLTLQWWDGGTVYLTPAEIQDAAMKLLSLCRADALPRVVHGHSRGATQLYRLMGAAGDARLEHLPAQGYLVECGALESSWATPDAAGQRVVLVAGRGDTRVTPASMVASEQALVARGASTKLLEVGVGDPKDHGALTREASSVDAALAFFSL